jgi:uncharacterized protein
VYAYANGEGVLNDLAEAVKWYRKAADQGFAPSQYTLGLFYRNGTGVPQNNPEAVKWYRKAADQGYRDAQFNLATMYAAGLGVPQNYVPAHMWRNLAAMGRITVASVLGIEIASASSAAVLNSTM